MKYMVMSIKDSYVVLLDENGKFVYGANRGYTKGEVVIDPWIMKDHRVKPLHYFKPIMIGLLSLATVLVLTIGFHVYTTTIQVIASVYLSINPQVRMDINRYGKVVEVIGNNADGIELVEGYDPGYKDQYEVADDLIDRAIKMGYLSDGDTIIIRVDASDQQTFVDLGIGYRTHLNAHLENKMDVTIEVMDVDYKQPMVEPTIVPTVIPTPTPLATPTPLPQVTPTPIVIDHQSDYGDSDYHDGGTSDYMDSTSDYDD